MSTHAIADRMDRLPANRYVRVILFFIFMGWFSECIDLGGTGYLLPTIRESFGLDAAMGGYYSSICYLGMFVGAIAAGTIADRIGRKKVMVVSMVFWGLCGLGMAFAPNFAVLFTLRFFLGLGLGAQFPVAMAYLSEIVGSKDRPKYITMYQLFAPVGFAFAGFLTAIILPHFSWQGVYIAEAIPALFVIGLIKVCPESPLWLEAQGRYDEADVVCKTFEEHATKVCEGGQLPPVVAVEREQEKGGMKELLKSKKYRLPIILCFFIWFISMFSDYGLTTWLTTILIQKGFSVVSSTWFVTIGVCGGIPAWFFTTWASKKFGRKKTFLIAGLITSIFGIIYGASTSMVMIIVFGICYMFGKYSNAMMLALYTPELYDTSVRGSGVSLATSWGRFGSIIGPIALAGMLSSLGTNLTFYIAVGMVIIPGLLVFILGPETKDKKF
jgi:MFS transporter, putative metabolite:H+ symporter